MAITKFERWKTSEKNSDDLVRRADGFTDKPVYEDESPAIQLLHDKVHELTDLINEHITKMAANDAKTGITTAQANAITANTAKTGITTQQASTITANDKAVNNNASEITKNTNAISNQAVEVNAAIKVGSYPLVLNPPAGFIQTHTSEVVYDFKLKKYFLNISYVEITPGKGGKSTRVIRTGQIELK